MREGIRRGGAHWLELHARIAAAALQLLCKHGYADMNMDRTAALAGVSKRTVYSHYDNKLDLAVAAVESLPAIRVDPGSDDIDPLEQLDAAIDELAAREDRFTPLLISALANKETHPEFLAAVRRGLLIPRLEAITVLVERGQRKGRFRAEVAPAAIAAIWTGQLVAEQVGLSSPRPAQRPKVLKALIHGVLLGPALG